MADEVTILRLGAPGDGVADTATGPVYVPDALPGETVIVERSGSRGRVVSRLTASPDRVAPFCPYYGRCGGCSAQHVGPALYGAWKRDGVVRELGRAGLDVEIGPLIDAHGAGRRRVTFHAREIDGVTKVGFMEARSHRLVAIAACPVTVAALGARAPQAATLLAGRLRSLRKPLDIAVTATETGLDVDIRGSGPLPDRLRQALIADAGALGLARLSLHGEVLVEPQRPLLTIGRTKISPGPGSFLQATEAGEAALSALVVEACGPARVVADLFAGIGPFALRLAERAEVHAVEVDGRALASLDAAFRCTPGLRRITTEARDLFRRPLLAPELARFDAVVLDPPRSGAEAQIRQLAASTAPLAIMVSCDPGTFSRDAAILAAGGLSAEQVTPVDQFKWSGHVELVGVFRRAKVGRRRR